ncbi:MAG: caspase family protein [Devosia sp.]
MGVRRIIAALLLVLTALSGAAAAEAPLKGIALVVGEAEYGSITPLANTTRDAAAVGGLLERLGFAVTTVTNADRAGLEAAISTFTADAAEADVALVYYSGHGIEAGGQNYLVPVDADLSSPQAAGASLVPVGELLDRLTAAVPVTIVLLDACRTDAFPPGTMIQPPGAVEPVEAVASGLGEMRGPTPVGRPGTDPRSLGLVIGFAASPGMPALDGEPGGNSPYATALLKHFSAGGYSFGDLMTLVTEEVYLKTRSRQLPWTNSSLRRILNFGTPVEDTSGDEAAIRTGRRDLLLSISTAPSATRDYVQTVAAASAVPMEKLFGLLSALGLDGSTDPAEINSRIEAAAERLSKLEARPEPAPAVEGEAARLVALATEAEGEGAWQQALGFRDRAIEAARGDATSNDGKARLAALLGEAAEAHWTLFELDKAAAQYEEARGLVAEFDQGLAARYTKLQADALSAIGQFNGDDSAFDEALTLYDAALTYYDGQADDDIWAETANDFANALGMYGQRREDDEYLNDSISAYQQVLDIWTRDSKPVDWARAQNNLGSSYAVLGDRSQDSDRWGQAIAAYRSALEVWSPDNQPLEWARANSNLGTVYRAIGNYEADADRLGQAVAAYRDALKEWTRERVPYDWAIAQNNLGNALTDLAKYDPGLERYSEGIAAFEAALDVWTPDTMPLNWATAQNNLGAAYATLGRRQEGAAAEASFGNAVAAYEACLTQRTVDREPQDWASTHYNLGLVFIDLAEFDEGTGALEKAVASFQASLDVYGADETPTDWADVQDNMGWALAMLGSRKGDAAMIRDGRSAMQAAYDYYRDYDGSAEYFDDRLAQIDAWLEAAS